jgi:cyclopropane fatty-acyl-phospholipid synthase-like methyltransferase
METRAMTQPTAYFDAFPDLFDAYTAIYDADGTANAWLLAHIPSAGNRAVDLGCGAGRHAVLLADRFHHVIAVDIAAGMLDLARTRRARPNIACQRRSILDVTADHDGRFDAVLSFAAVHHLGNHDRALPHIRSLAPPGGTVVVVDIVRPDDGWRSRAWHVGHAHQEADRIRQQTGSEEAARIAYELRTHPRWLDHVTTNIPLTRDEFKHRYATAFSGATFEDNHPIMCAMRWTAPTAP